MSEGIDSLVLVGDYSDGPVTYTITAATLDGVPVQPDLADLFDLVLDLLNDRDYDDRHAAEWDQWDRRLEDYEPADTPGIFPDWGHL